MPTDAERLKGEVSEKPEIESLEVERLVAAFLRSLLDEQRPPGPQGRMSGGAAG